MGGLVLGVARVPVTGESYFAVKGAGAPKNERALLSCASGSFQGVGSGVWEAPALVSKPVPPVPVVILGNGVN